MSVSEHDEKRKQIQAEYQQWKESAEVLYDLVVTHNLVWPTLTCQWMPERTEKEGIVSQELLLGTHTNDEEPNSIHFTSFELPKDIDESSEKSKARMEIKQRITHEGEVNRARYQPSNPCIIATKTRAGDVLVFDRSKMEAAGQCEPMLRLKGHTMEGYGLAWNPHSATSNHLLSAGYDTHICHWDIGQGGRELTPYQRYSAHTQSVEDVSWNAANNAVFASVADDMKLLIWDSRTPSKPVQDVVAHHDNINTVAFHPREGGKLATGSADKTIGVFDIRNLSSKWHTLEHQGEITQVAWSPHDDPILASAGADRKICIWDLRRNGEEQTQEDAEDGPPELMFVHAGHTSAIAEFSWDPLERWRIASAAEDNIVHVWKMSKDIYAPDEVVVKASDLE